MARRGTKAVSWEAHEYIHHEKDALWFVLFAVVIIALLAAVYFILEGDIISMATIALMSVALLVYANRKPKTLKYSITEEGIKIDEQEYVFADFKSFSIVGTGQIDSIYLEPLKRYMPPISIFYEPKDADKILDMLHQNLPNREYKPDLVDSFVHRFRL